MDIITLNKISDGRQAGFAIEIKRKIIYNGHNKAINVFTEEKVSLVISKDVIENVNNKATNFLKVENNFVLAV